MATLFLPKNDVKSKSLVKWKKILVSNILLNFQEVCKHLQEDATGVTLIENIVGAANVYANFTGQAKCLDINQQATGNLGDQGWDFQVRTHGSIWCFSNTEQ